MRNKTFIPADKPPDARVFQALLLVAGVLGERYAYWHRGRYHFTIDENWTIALSAYSGERLRVEACLKTVPRDRLWVLADDSQRLAGLVVELREAIGRVTA